MSYFRPPSAKSEKPDYRPGSGRFLVVDHLSPADIYRVTEFNRTFLGIDYGERRIGLAKSDPTGLIASALTTLEVRSPADALNQVQAIIQKCLPDGIVIGYPLHESGEMTGKCREIDRFVEKLSEIYAGPIHRVDERYSTMEAHSVIHAHGKKTGRDKGRIDRIAAVIILQRFLDESGAQN